MRIKFWPVSAANTKVIRAIVVALVVVAVLGWRANLFGALSEAPFVSATTLTDLARASDVMPIRARIDIADYGIASRPPGK